VDLKFVVLAFAVLLLANTGLAYYNSYNYVPENAYYTYPDYYAGYYSGSGFQYPSYYSGYHYEYSSGYYSYSTGYYPLSYYPSGSSGYYSYSTYYSGQNYVQPCHEDPRYSSSGYVNQLSSPAYFVPRIVFSWFS